MSTSSIAFPIQTSAQRDPSATTSTDSGNRTDRRATFEAALDDAARPGPTKEGRAEHGGETLVGRSKGDEARAMTAPGLDAGVEAAPTDTSTSARARGSASTHDPSIPHRPERTDTASTLDPKSKTSLVSRRRSPAADARGPETEGDGNTDGTPLSMAVVPVTPNSTPIITSTANVVATPTDALPTTDENRASPGASPSRVGASKDGDATNAALAPMERDAMRIDPPPTARLVTSVDETVAVSGSSPDDLRALASTRLGGAPAIDGSAPSKDASRPHSNERVSTEAETSSMPTLGLSEALLARMTKASASDLSARDLEHVRDAASSLRGRSPSQAAEVAASPRPIARTGPSPAINIASVSDFARTIGADISWRVLPHAGDARPAPAQDAKPTHATDKMVSANASSANDDSTVRASATNDPLARATADEHVRAADRATPDGGLSASEPDRVTAAPERPRAQATPLVTEEVDTVASDAPKSVTRAVDASAQAVKPSDNTKRRDPASQGANDVVPIRGTENATRGLDPHGSRSTVGTTHAQIASSERLAERQANAEIAVSRMTLKTGVRAETVLADLGRVSVEARTHAERVDLRVVAERPETAELLRAGRSELRADLDRAHVPVSGLSIDAGSRQTSQGSHRESHDRRQADGSGPQTSLNSLSDDVEPTTFSRETRRVRIVL